MRYVEVLPKEKCLKIAEIIGHNFGNDEENLLYLPDKVFGNRWIIDYEAEEFVVYDGENTTVHWHIPPYFCKVVSIGNPFKESK